MRDRENWDDFMNMVKQRFGKDMVEQYVDETSVCRVFSIDLKRKTSQKKRQMKRRLT